MLVENTFQNRAQVFTVIAGDSWNTIMYRTMENTSSVSAVFFVALIVLGEVCMPSALRSACEIHAAQVASITSAYSSY